MLTEIGPQALDLPVSQSAGDAAPDAPPTATVKQLREQEEGIQRFMVLAATAEVTRLQAALAEATAEAAAARRDGVTAAADASAAREARDTAAAEAERLRDALAMQRAHVERISAIADSQNNNASRG